MNIKESKYDFMHSEIIQITDNTSDLRLNLKLKKNTNTFNIVGVISGVIVDEFHKPIKAALVKVVDSNLDPITYVFTDDNGNYTISIAAKAINYNIIISAKGKISIKSDSFSLLNGENKIINFKLNSDSNNTFGVIGGSIFDKNNKMYVMGATLKLYDTINNEKKLVAITYSNEEGEFAFSNINKSKYVIQISALGYFSINIVQTLEQQEILDIKVPLQFNENSPQSIVSGIITDESNIPISEADIILYSVDNINNITPVAFTRTNSSGIYTFLNVPTGDYIVKSNKSQIINNSGTKIPTATLPNTNTIPSSTIPTITIPTITTPSNTIPNIVAPTISTDYIQYASSGVLTSSAFLDSETNLVSGIGGPNDGGKTLTMKVDSKGLYNVSIEYFSNNLNEALTIDVNGINTGLIYTPPMTNEKTNIFNISVNLNEGYNTMKFHGDGINYAPDLGLVLITKENIPNEEPILSYNLKQNFG